MYVGNKPVYGEKVLLTKHLELVLRTDLWTRLDTVVTSSVDYRRVDKLSKPAEYH